MTVGNSTGGGDLGRRRRRRRHRHHHRLSKECDTMVGRGTQQ